MTVVAAMGQMFYSLSIAMGVLYTYGSYLDRRADIEKSTTQLELFDTAIAMLAGLIVIPSVFSFSGGDMEMLKAGPSLAFITLPRIFASMGAGGIIGIAFFLMFLLAALTSAISLMETSVSTLEDVKSPIHSASPSSEWRHMTCMPTQMPSTGRRRSRMTCTRPAPRRFSMASAALPTPGSSTRSAWKRLFP